MSVRSRIPADQVSTAKTAISLPRLISHTVRLHRESNLFVGLCPFHREKTPSFYVWSDHYHCFGCGVHGDAISWLMVQHSLSFHEAVAYLRGDITNGEFQLPEKPQQQTSRKGNLLIAQRVWGEARDPAGTPAEDYLTHRRLTLPEEPVIRFHPSCPCGDGRMPAMVALMSDPATGEPSGIHRTFLRPDGLGKISKQMLGPAGVIRLFERITNGLGLAEGIETALAVAQRVGWGPVWAAGSAGGIRTFPVLVQTTLNIFADCDDTGAGLKAARECARRWANAGTEALIHFPRDGKDWDQATLDNLS